MSRNQSSNLFDLIAARAPHPNKLALETRDATALTYGELFARSAQAANALVSLGVKPGDRVAAQIEKSTDVIVVTLACLRAGAVLLPLNTAYTLAELEYFLGDAEPALTLCRPEGLEPIRTLAQELNLSSVESLGVKGDGTFAAMIDAAPTEFETTPRASDDLAAILYTSGTTGRSKGAMLTHENLSSNALTLIDCWRFGSADRLIHALPVFHTHGLFVAVNVALLSGATMIFMPRFDPEAVIAALPGSDGDDGGADVLYAAARPIRPRSRPLREHASLRLGLCAAACRDPCRLAGADRVRNSRALRHDRDQHDHVEPLRRRTPAGLGRLCASAG